MHPKPYFLKTALLLEKKGEQLLHKNGQFRWLYLIKLVNINQNLLFCSNTIKRSWKTIEMLFLSHVAPRRKWGQNSARLSQFSSFYPLLCFVCLPKNSTPLLSDFPFHSLVYYVSECIPAIAWMEDQNDRKWLHLEERSSLQVIF